MDLPSFVRCTSSSIQAWSKNCSIRHNLTKNTIYYLYLLVCLQLLLRHECCKWPCTLGLEVTSDCGRQRANHQFLKLSHHPREWSWVPLLVEGGKKRREQARGGRGKILIAWRTFEVISFISLIDRRGRCSGRESDFPKLIWTGGAGARSLSLEFP